jgi:hypothetical protein
MWMYNVRQKVRTRIYEKAKCTSHVTLFLSIAVHLRTIATQFYSCFCTARNCATAIAIVTQSAFALRRNRTHGLRIKWTSSSLSYLIATVFFLSLFLILSFFCFALSVCRSKYKLVTYIVNMKKNHFNVRCIGIEVKEKATRYPIDKTEPLLHTDTD